MKNLKKEIHFKTITRLRGLSMLAYIVLLLLFSGIESFAQEGILVPFLKNGQYGYASTSGEIVIKPAYDEADLFEGQGVRVKVGEVYGVVNRNGEWIIKPQYAKMTPFINGYAVIGDEKNQKLFSCNIINDAGKMMHEFDGEIGLASVHFPFIVKNFGGIGSSIYNLDGTKLELPYESEFINKTVVYDNQHAVVNVRSKLVFFNLLSGKSMIIEEPNIKHSFSYIDSVFVLYHPDKKGFSKIVNTNYEILSDWEDQIKFANKNFKIYKSESSSFDGYIIKVNSNPDVSHKISFYEIVDEDHIVCTHPESSEKFLLRSDGVTVAEHKHFKISKSGRIADINDYDDREESRFYDLKNQRIMENELYSNLNILDNEDYYLTVRTNANFYDNQIIYNSKLEKTCEIKANILFYDLVESAFYVHKDDQVSLFNFNCDELSVVKNVKSVSHFRDFILIKLMDGSLKIFDKDGKFLVETKEELRISSFERHKPSLFRVRNNNKKWVYFNRDGVAFF